MCPEPMMVSVLVSGGLGGPRGNWKGEGLRNGDPESRDMFTARQNGIRYREQESWRGFQDTVFYMGN